VIVPCELFGMNNPNQTLSEQIERLVREHIEASRRAAAAAVERAFCAASSSPRSMPTRSAARTVRTRRASTEVAALAQRLYEAVCAQPGETMSVLGPELGATPRELHLPMKQLKHAGRVRSVGERHQTRYFPSERLGVIRARARCSNRDPFARLPAEALWPGISRARLRSRRGAAQQLVAADKARSR